MEAEGKEMAFKTKTVVRENTEYKVRLFKILESRASGTTHLSSASVVVFLHSLDNEPTFNDLQIQLEMISSSLPDSCVIAVVGTKKDIVDEEELTARMEGAQITYEDRSYIFGAVSCLTGDGFEELFEEILSKIT